MGLHAAPDHEWMQLQLQGAAATQGDGPNSQAWSLYPTRPPFQPARHELTVCAHLHKHTRAHVRRHKQRMLLEALLPKQVIQEMQTDTKHITDLAAAPRLNTAGGCDGAMRG